MAERNITREQTAKMLIDALEKETAEPEQSSYTDVANNRWSYRWVEAASKEGYMVGYNGGAGNQPQYQRSYRCISYHG